MLMEKTTSGLKACIDLTIDLIVLWELIEWA